MGGEGRMTQKSRHGRINSSLLCLCDRAIGGWLLMWSGSIVIAELMDKRPFPNFIIAMYYTQRHSQHGGQQDFPFSNYEILNRMLDTYWAKAEGKSHSKWLGWVRHSRNIINTIIILIIILSNIYINPLIN